METLSEKKIATFLKEALYTILPLVSQRSRRVYLEVILQAVPFIAKHFPADQARPFLAFLEEQWNV